MFDPKKQIDKFRMMPILVVRANPAIRYRNHKPKVGHHVAYRIESRPVHRPKPAKAERQEERMQLVVGLVQKTARYRWLIDNHRYVDARKLIERALLREVEHQVALTIVDQYQLPDKANQLKGSTLLTMRMVDQQLGGSGTPFTNENINKAAKTEAVIDLANPDAKPDEARSIFQSEWSTIVGEQEFGEDPSKFASDMLTGTDEPFAIVSRAAGEINGDIEALDASFAPAYLPIGSAYTGGTTWVDGKGWVTVPPQQNPDEPEPPPEKEPQSGPEEEEIVVPDDPEDEVNDSNSTPNPMADDEVGSFVIFLDLLVDQFLGGSTLRQLDALIALHHNGGVSDPSPIADSSAALLLDGATFRLVAKNIAHGTGGWVDGVRAEELLPDLNVYQMQEIQRKLSGGNAVDPSPESDPTSLPNSPINPFDNQLPVVGPIPKAREFSISAVKLMAKTLLVPRP
jgi:hypothetical protein